MNATHNCDLSPDWWDIKDILWQQTSILRFIAVNEERVQIEICNCFSIPTQFNVSKRTLYRGASACKECINQRAEGADGVCTWALCLACDIYLDRANSA